MFIDSDIPTIVTSQTAERILALQRRCVACGSSGYLHIHHRIHRSEQEFGLYNFLSRMLPLYEKTYNKIANFWHLHSLENLVCLCKECHEGPTGVHGGNEKLRQILRYSFTCPVTGFNVSYIRPKNSIIFTF